MILYKVPTTNLFERSTSTGIVVKDENETHYSYDKGDNHIIYIGKDSIGKWGAVNNILYADHYFYSWKEAEKFELLQTQKKIEQLTDALNIQSDRLVSITSEIDSEAF